MPNLSKHLKLVHSNNPCGICDKSFGAKNYWAHIYVEHLPQIFVELEIIDNLQTTDPKKKDSITQCIVNKKTLKDENNGHKCLLCDKYFNTGTGIHNHMKSHIF